MQSPRLGRSLLQVLNVLQQQSCSSLRVPLGREAASAEWGAANSWPSAPPCLLQQVAAVHNTVSTHAGQLQAAALWRMPKTEPVWEDSQPSTSPSQPAVDPFAVVQGEVDAISERLRCSVTSHIPSLSQAAEYLFRRGVQGKRLRPTLVMLIASALAPQAPGPDSLSVDLRPASAHTSEPRRRQQRIAEVAEMMHVASLLHDDVIDEATTRRGVLSLNSKAGNKMAILAGDFLLARASVTLAALQNTVIVELMSNVLENLVCGEVMQMTAGSDQAQSLDHYLEKTYCKTAALMANSSRCAAILGGHPPEVCELAWSYARHLGLAFQVVDDVLDLTASSSTLGKPAHNDLRSGLATAPVLFAAEQQPDLRPLIARRFKHDGDVTRAVQLIQASSGIERAQDLAKHHCQMAVHMIESLPPAQSEHAARARAALIGITQKVLNRKK